MKHTKTDPVCIHYRTTGPFRRYLNERHRGEACLICVPAWTSNPLSAYHKQVMRDGQDAAVAYIKATSTDGSQP